MTIPTFHDFDMILINTSGGKDSQAMTDYVVKEAENQEYPLDQIVLAHADLGRIEWDDTKDLVKSHAEHYGLRLIVEKRPQGDLLAHFRARWEELKAQASAIEETLNEDYSREDWDDIWGVTLRRLKARSEKAYQRVLKAQAKKAAETEGWQEGDEMPTLSDYDIGKIARDLRETPPWSSPTNRYCTSDHKRGQINRAYTMLTEELRVKLKLGTKGKFKRKVQFINCFGFRADESPARAARPPWEKNRTASTKTTRDVWNWLPIHTWPEDEVWLQIDQAGTQWHWAYDRGMSRLSCRFCIFAPRNQLMISAIQPENQQLFGEYVEFERECGFTFTQEVSLVKLKEDIDQGKKPDYNDTGEWNM